VIWGRKHPNIPATQKALQQKWYKLDKVSPGLPMQAELHDLFSNPKLRKPNGGRSEKLSDRVSTGKGD